MDSPLRAFHRDILRAVIHLDDPAGLEIKDWLEDHGGYDVVRHGRLYPNLDEMVTHGYLDKREADGRTNEYVLTPQGRREVREWAEEWVGAVLEIDPDWLEDQHEDRAWEQAVEVEP